jgi:hypothetical protein
MVHLRQCYKNICGVYEAVHGQKLSKESRKAIKKMVKL